MADLKQYITAIQNELVEWRRYLHAHPELSFQEYETSNWIAKKLTSFGLDITRPTTTSVMAILRKGSPKKTLALRADIDALPITEQNTFEFLSTSPGAMHACGHDGHTAVLLAVAKLLTQEIDFDGEIRFIFQHAEEVSPGGARDLVAAGVLDGVDLVLGTHLWVPLEVGQIGIIYGPAMASPDDFELTIQGKGGHASAPQDTVDAILIGAQIVNAFHQVVSRQVDPLLSAVVCVNEFHAGTANNIIADTATLTGTIRTYDEQLRAEMPIKLEKLVQHICFMHGATYEWNYRFGYDPVINEETATKLMEEVVREQFGDASVNDMRPLMGAEDFSAYGKQAPSCFFFTGAGNVEKGIIYPHHHPKFTIDEDAMLHAVELFVAASLKFFA